MLDTYLPTISTRYRIYRDIGYLLICSWSTTQRKLSSHISPRSWQNSYRRIHPSRTEASRGGRRTDVQEKRPALGLPATGVGQFRRNRLGRDPQAERCRCSVSSMWWLQRLSQEIWRRYPVRPEERLVHTVIAITRVGLRSSCLSTSSMKDTFHNELWSCFEDIYPEAWSGSSWKMFGF